MKKNMKKNIFKMFNESKLSSNNELKKIFKKIKIKNVVDRIDYMVKVTKTIQTDNIIFERYYKGNNDGYGKYFYYINDDFVCETSDPYDNFLEIINIDTCKQIYQKNNIKQLTFDIFYDLICFMFYIFNE